MIYSIPTIEAMGGGDFISGMPILAHMAIAPLLRAQPCIRNVYHLSEKGLPANFVNLSRFRDHPLFTRKHIVELHAEMMTEDVLVSPGCYTERSYNIGQSWKNGWLNLERDGTIWPQRLFDLLPKSPRTEPGRRSWNDFAVVAVTSRYRDRFFSWKKEIKFIRSQVKTIYFLGHELEFRDFARKHPGIDWVKTDNLLEAAFFIQRAKLFSGNQSSMLAIRQGLGLPYRFEQSPNHLDTEQGSKHETILNPRTRRLHLATICIKKALFDIKEKRYHA